VAKVIFLAAVVGDKAHGISLSYVFGMSFHEIWSPDPFDVVDGKRDVNHMPFVVCHRVSIVDLYSYIVIVKPISS
jgi:hypothetical protein